jgi:UDP-sugar transporter A1/2/3
MHCLNQNSFSSLLSDVFGRNSNWLAMTIPAILYLLQNNLQYYSVRLLDAATFQVTYQLKILTTALCSVLILNKKLRLTQWGSLIVLTAGIALVQLPSFDGNLELDVDRVTGLLGVVASCLLSGLAGVWFEKVLKESKATLWVRNIQLSIFSLLPGLIFGGLSSFS